MIITKRHSNLMEINFFETFLDEIFIDWNCVQKETFMKMDFKILRVNILSKFFLKITLMKILKFSC